MSQSTKPIIVIGADVAADGIRDRAYAFTTYVESLKRAGAIPLVVPPQADNVGDLLASVDGVLLAGGPDCDPTAYGEERHPATAPMDCRRQANDYALARLAREHKVPTLGICLGMQMMNVASGGTLIQDIASEHAGALEHASDPDDRFRHDVEVADGTRLAAIIGPGLKNVNSSHHQAIRVPGRGLQITAKAPDGIVEALESAGDTFYVGVQWHPEDMDGEETASRLFAAFVEAARQYRQRRFAADTRS